MHHQPSWYLKCANHIAKYIMCHPWLSVGIIVVGLAFCSVLHYLPSDSSDDKQPSMGANTDRSINLSVLGIYYCQLVAGHTANGTAASVELAQEPDCYQLILYGNRYPFRCNLESGRIDCQMLGPGSIYLDKYTNEIIIEFEGWKLKRFSQC